MELGSELSGSGCGGLIVEAEVYIGPEDRASHAWNARRTTRTEVLFGARGHAYVFQIYGAHYCFNIVVGAGRVPAAVLIRALRPTFGLEVMAKNRGLASVPANLRQLTSGPGRLAQALGIDRRANGLDLVTRRCGFGALRLDAVWSLSMESEPGSESTSIMPGTGHGETGDSRSRTIHLSAFDGVWTGSWNHRDDDAFACLR